jgi:hypothetical protein
MSGGSIPVSPRRDAMKGVPQIKGRGKVIHAGSYEARRPEPATRAVRDPGSVETLRASSRLLIVAVAITSKVKHGAAAQRGLRGHAERYSCGRD